ncbi:MAG: 2-amino-4-hydroxy-6-hydroxymethyldihydropteridine diphosphokinase [Candidatus Eisenbacteria bacterium]|nr:2-amino-4-hydroxy-6-hydroxymethyldihydropteridine diphosphokinase [Candidatus Eisenbacteria bacterium]
MVEPFADLRRREGSGNRMRRVWLGLGGNQGDRAAHLSRALAALEERGFSPEAASPIYETAPWGEAGQPAFLNQVVRGRWPGEPERLLGAAKEIEAELGRTAGRRWGPRPIDIDILLAGAAGESLIHRPGLTIPHPRLAERGFVLVPLNDLDPGLRVPGTGASVAELLRRLAPPPEAVRRYGHGDAKRETGDE